jgi:hypothetical protein
MYVLVQATATQKGVASQDVKKDLLDPSAHPAASAMLGEDREDQAWTARPVLLKSHVGHCVLGTKMKIGEHSSARLGYPGHVNEEEQLRGKAKL